MQECNIVTTSQKLIIEFNFSVYLITIKLQKQKKLHTAAIVNISVCDVGDDLCSKG